MKDLPYIKPLYLDNPDIMIMDWTGTDTDIYKKTILPTKKISDGDIYHEFLEMINGFNYSKYPLHFRKNHVIRTEVRGDIKRLRMLFKEAYSLIRKNGLVGYPNFIITNDKIAEYVNEFINEDKKYFEVIPEIIIDNDLDYLLLGRRTGKGQPGVFIFYIDDEYTMESIGFRPQEQYVKLNIYLT